MDVLIKPRRPLKEGYGYEIKVEVESEFKDTPGMVDYVGTPAVYVYSSGRLEEPSSAGKEAEGWKFCINCGSRLPPLANYCPTCGEKQEF